MERGKNLLDKILRRISGGFFGILSMIIRVLCDFFAYLYFPGYNIFENMVSELGVGKGGIFFNLGLIISGIICIPFYIALLRSLTIEYSYDKTRKTALTFFYISNICYILVGLFPSIKENIVIFYIHGTLALISWLTGIIYLLIIAGLMLKNNKYSKFNAYVTLMLVIFLSIAVSTWQPITEWLMTFMFIIWICIISTSMIYKKI
jgi:hypothetical membrane protein